MIHDKTRCQLLFCDLCLNPKVAASQGREQEAQAERGDGMLHDYAGCLSPPLRICTRAMSRATPPASRRPTLRSGCGSWELTSRTAAATRA